MKSLQALALDWQALSPLLDEALALPTEDRAAWLERLGPQAEGLRPRLRELLDLQEDVRTRGFLEALPVLPGLQAPALSVQVGDQVGPYRLVDEIGRGGMGTVWLAERADGLLKRRCALKLPLLAWSDSLRERMAQERDILAGLDHPHIARLLDTGVDDQGRPFLALEHVQGDPIDVWMDARKLAVRDRVAQFLQVVDAIRYAHANLVIHRDLKPSNILVTAQGQAKLLDFGIAKLLSDASAGEPSDLTKTGQRLLTPRYASPEQILGQRLTAASDVYSLGVLLHELLCGQPPYAAGKTPDKLPEQAVLEADVRAPSRRSASAEEAARRSTTPERLSRQLRGELDAIVLRAMARVPQERYASAEALQADLHAWLDGRPVQARNPGALAVAWKFVRRHQWPVGIGTAGVVATVVMAVVAAGQARDSDRQAKRAALQAKNASETRQFLSEILKGMDPSSQQGQEVQLPQLLEKAEATVEARYAGQPELRETVLWEIAELWSSQGDQRRRLQTLEKRTKALEESRSTIELAENLLRSAGISLEQLRDFDQSDRLLDRFEAIARTEKLPAAQLFHYEMTRGWLNARQEKLEPALGAFSRAAERARSIGQPQSLAYALRGMSSMQYRMLKWNEARKSLEELRALIRGPSSGWDAKDRRAIRWEFAQELLTRGRYVEGWAEVQSLRDDDSRMFGPYDRRWNSTQRLWLRWCITMREETRAAAWLRERELDLGSPDKVWAVDPDWMLAAGEVHALAGDRNRALAALQRAQSAIFERPAGEGKEALAGRLWIARARVAIWLRDTEMMAASVQAIPEPKALATSKVWSQGRSAYVLYQALEARLQRTPEKSLLHLVEAERALEASLEPNHPELSVMRLNRAWLEFLLKRSEASADEIRQASTLIREALPPVHPAAQAAARAATETGATATGTAKGTDPEKPQLSPIGLVRIML